MKIPISELLKEYNEGRTPKLTKIGLAQKMVKAGVYTSDVSALNMMRYNEAGKAQSLDNELLNFICDFFDKTYSEIIIR